MRNGQPSVCSVIPNTFPPLRRSALRSLEREASTASTPNHLEPLRHLIHWLSSNDFHSIVLPPDGEFISARTVCSAQFAALRLPFQRFVMEYTLSRTEGVYIEELRHLATLLIVNQLQPSTFEVCSVCCRASGLWDPPPMRLLLAPQSSIEIDGKGGVHLDGLVSIAHLDGEYSDREVELYIAGYREHLRVLAHFLIICASEHIQLEQDFLSTGHTGYFVKCNGPSSHRWLPTSGLSHP